MGPDEDAAACRGIALSLIISGVLLLILLGLGALFMWNIHI